MNLNLKEKVIIVSGGASGIGEAIVSQLALEGAFPVIIDKNAEQNTRVLEKIMAAGTFGFAIAADLTHPEACKKAIDEVLTRFGRIDGLVNNAGKNDSVSLENGTYEDFMASYHQNAVHYFLLAKYALPSLKTSKGVILNISSKVAETGQGGTSGYAAACGARNALTREWAVELLPFNIRVNAIIVAEVYTPMYKNWVEKQEKPEEKLREIQAKIPLGNRFTTAEEIANTACFVLSNRSSHTTGQLIHIDGGYVHLDR
jgi:L-fucose dehydrogenase